MGTSNAELIRACEQARKNGNQDELDRTSRLVEESQAVCTHPSGEYQAHKVHKTSPTGKYRQGDIVKFCGRCSKILSSDRPLAPEWGVWCLEDRAWCAGTVGSHDHAATQLPLWVSGEAAGVDPERFHYELRKTTP